MLRTAPGSVSLTGAGRLRAHCPSHAWTQLLCCKVHLFPFPDENSGSKTSLEICTRSSFFWILWIKKKLLYLSFPVTCSTVYEIFFYMEYGGTIWQKLTNICSISFTFYYYANIASKTEKFLSVKVGAQIWKVGNDRAQIFFFFKGYTVGSPIVPLQASSFITFTTSTHKHNNSWVKIGIQGLLSLTKKNLEHQTQGPGATFGESLKSS